MDLIARNSADQGTDFLDILLVTMREIRNAWTDGWEKNVMLPNARLDVALNMENAMHLMSANVITAGKGSYATNVSLIRDVFTEPAPNLGNVSATRTGEDFYVIKT